jgi:hypothetical protein
MKEKFVILKSNECNGFWSYYGHPIDRDEPIVDEFNDRFISTDTTEAVQFDSYDAAVEEIKSFESLGSVKEDVSSTETTYRQLGAGLYRIERIYVIEKDHELNQASRELENALTQIK